MSGLRGHMYPGFLSWWHGRHGCGPRVAYAGFDAGCGPGASRDAREEVRSASGFDEAAAFGVRRPLRFLAYKLGLEREQMAELAAILDDLKTERAQAAVDERRSTAAFADALTKAAFDAAKVAEAGELRVKSADQLQKAVARALARIHTLLDEEQRGKFAYYLRTGTIVI